jgi:hypothetical protein
LKYCWKGWKVSQVSERENQLEWTAFCYASGELSPAEAEQFEARLADDQEAREALARAVELTQVVAAAESRWGEVVTTPSLERRNGAARRVGVRSASWVTRLSWAAIGGLAALALAMVWSGGWSPWGFGPEKAGISNENDALASAWSAARIEMSEASEVGPLHPLTASNSDASDESADSEISDSELPADELAVADAPAWMTIAIEGLASEMMDQDESGDEPVVN